MDERGRLAKRIEDACGKAGVDIQGLGLERLLSDEISGSNNSKEIEISYR